MMVTSYRHGGGGGGGGWSPILGSSSSSSSSETNDTTTTNEEDNIKNCDFLSLESIRSTLIRQEETIIFALIERSQFRKNDAVYDKDCGNDFGLPPGCREGLEFDSSRLSFLEYMLMGTEILHCGVRRYTSPEEHAFFPQILPPTTILPPLHYPPNLLSPINNASSLNFNPILLSKYTSTILPSITRIGDDEQHGSTVLADIAALQALSRRVHYGKFVAESKFRADEGRYRDLVERGDAKGVMDLLTNQKVEEMVLRRARLKAATYGREPLLAGLPDGVVGGGEDDDDRQTEVVAAAAASAVVAAVEAMRDGRKEGRGAKVDPKKIESVYRDIIIPMTKDIEVAYLFRRCGKYPPSAYAPDRMSVDFLGANGEA